MSLPASFSRLTSRRAAAISRRQAAGLAAAVAGEPANPLLELPPAGL